MKSVADFLRAEAAEDARSLTPQQRVELSLRLGDDDVEVYRRARGLSRSAAVIELRQRRQDGRRPSRCLREMPE